MNRRTRILAGAALLALVAAGCSKLDPVHPKVTGTSDWNTYVALGTSISAGGQSAGVVETHQANAFPALFARQARVPAFTYDRVSPDGIPPLLELKSLNPLVVSNAGRALGAPRDLAQPTAYHNLGVYGSVIFDVASTARYGTPPYDVFFGMVARGRGSLLEQAVSLDPDLVSFEYGSNEVLGPALAGIGTPVFSVGEFTTLLGATLSGLQAALPEAKLVLVNVPDVTSVPYVSWPNFYLGAVRALVIGPDGPLGAGDYILISALDSLRVGTGLPAYAGGNGRPLLPSQVLSADEATSLQQAIDGYNAAIAAEASARGAALVDLNGLFRSIARNGYTFGGVHYTTLYVSGGLFSLDGVHPTDLAQGLIANAMIDAVNARFGTHTPNVDLRTVATATSSRALPAPTRATSSWPTIEGLQDLLRSIPAHR